MFDETVVRSSPRQGVVAGEKVAAIAGRNVYLYRQRKEMRNDESTPALLARRRKKEEG